MKQTVAGRKAVTERITIIWEREDKFRRASIAQDFSGFLEASRAFSDLLTMLADLAKEDQEKKEDDSPRRQP